VLRFADEEIKVRLRLIPVGSRFLTVQMNFDLRRTMQNFWKRRVLVTAGALALIAGLLGLGWSSLFPRTVMIQDPAFHLKFCTLTCGTNHVMFSGGKFLARLNRKLSSFGVRPLTGDRIYELRSGRDAAALGVEYSYDGDSPQGSKRPNELLSALIIQPGGAAIPLRKRIHSTAATKPGERLSMWLIPEAITNFAGCQLHLSRIDDGKDVATLRLYEAD
jgi:hypothetical protein